MIAINLNGEIKTFATIPNEWKNTDGTKTLGYNYLDTSIHYIDGFRDVVDVVFNPDTQYKGGLIYDTVNNVYTYEVIDYTVEVVAERLVVKEDNEDKSDIEVLINRGQRLTEKLKTRLVRRRKKGLITKLRCKKVREILHPIILKLNTGDIDIANDEAILIPVNGNADIEAELVWFKAELQNLLLDVNNLL